MARNRTVPSQAPFGFLVKELDMVSETDPEVVYKGIRPPYCPCPSFRFNVERNNDPTCKHLRKVAEAGLYHWLDPFGEGVNEREAV